MLCCPTLQIARKLKGIGDDLDAKVQKEIREATAELLLTKSIFQVLILLFHWNAHFGVHVTHGRLELLSSIMCVPESCRDAPLS